MKIGLRSHATHFICTLQFHTHVCMLDFSAAHARILVQAPHFTRWVQPTATHLWVYPRHLRRIHITPIAQKRRREKRGNVDSFKFPHVCPEPVWAKSRFSMTKWRQERRFHRTLSRLPARVVQRNYPAHRPHAQPHGPFAPAQPALAQCPAAH